MREVLDFDPTPTILHSQEDVIEYLEKHRGPLPPGIEVEWCPPKTNFKLPKRCVFPPSSFDAEDATFIAQLYPPSIVLLQYRSDPVDARCVANNPGYESLCVDFAAISYNLEDFVTFYTIRKLPSGFHCFTPWGSWQKLIINLSDSDNGWNCTVIRVFGPWKAAAKSDRGSIPRAWNTGVITQCNELVWKSLRSEPRNYTRSNTICVTRVGF